MSGSTMILFPLHPFARRSRPSLWQLYQQPIFIKDLGHEQPTVLLTNDFHATPSALIMDRPTRGA